MIISLKGIYRPLQRHFRQKGKFLRILLVSVGCIQLQLKLKSSLGFSIGHPVFMFCLRLNSFPAIDAPGGFLFEWWSVFWDIFIARTNEKHSDVAATYIEASYHIFLF